MPGPDTETIVAVATPPGRGGVGIVRISGARALDVLRKLLRATPASLEPHRLYHGWLPDPSGGGQALDEILYVLMPGPRSYTGEDVVEIQAHGSPLVLDAIVHAAIAAGARPAEPGAFTKRAFLNGRMDLTQAEAVVDLINAQTGRALRTAAHQLRGGTRRACEAVQERLADLLAEVEAWIDFPEEDLPPQDGKRLAEEAHACRISVAGWLATWREGRALHEGTRVVLVGRPNAGKSSLLNALAGEDRAIVTPHPGTTRDFLEAMISCEGFPVTLVDTAGIRVTADSVEDEGVQRAREQASQADWVLVVLDTSEPLRNEDWEILAEIAPDRRLVVCTKTDCEAVWSMDDLDEEAGLAIGNSVKTRIDDPASFGALARAIARQISQVEHPASDVIVSSARQREALARADAALGRVSVTLSGPLLRLDLVAADLREALDGLGDLVGRIDTEAVLDRIFSRFCIGK